MSLFVIVGSEITIKSFNDREAYLYCLFNEQSFSDFEKAISTLEEQPKDFFEESGEQLIEVIK